jgi:hypothetical protein
VDALRVKRSADDIVTLFAPDETHDTLMFGHVRSIHSRKK